MSAAENAGEQSGSPADPADDVQSRIATFQQQLSALTPRAFLTPTIVAINLAVFAIMAARGVHILSPEIGDLLSWGANYAPKTTDGEWWRLFTSNYLHIGVIHIAFNMWVLWDVGRLVERLLAWGSPAMVMPTFKRSSFASARRKRR